MKVLILGVNGFIGHHLTQRILSETDWEVDGIDLASYRVEPFLKNPRFHFEKGDISYNRKWVESRVSASNKNVGRSQSVESVGVTAHPKCRLEPELQTAVNESPVARITVSVAGWIRVRGRGTATNAVSVWVSTSIRRS